MKRCALKVGHAGRCLFIQANLAPVLGECGTPAKAEWPEIPDTCKNPIVFEDKNLGICMVAELGGRQWIMKVNGSGSWMTVRPVAPDDPNFVEALNKGAESEGEIAKYWDAFLEYTGTDVCWLSPARLLESYHEWLATKIANGERVFPVAHSE
jgi:hypothetical protein